MAGERVTVAGAEVVLADGLVAIPTETLIGLIPQDYTKNGVTLANERRKVVVHIANPEDCVGPGGTTIPKGTPIPCEFTLSIFVSRGAMSQDEANKVSAVGADRDRKQAERKERDDAALRKEKELMFDLGMRAARK